MGDLIRRWLGQAEEPVVDQPGPNAAEAEVDLVDQAEVFQTLRVSDVMTPRADIAALDVALKQGFQNYLVVGLLVALALLAEIGIVAAAATFGGGPAFDPKPGAATNPPAAAFGPEVAASLVSGIARQIKPHWTAPQGVDADKLVTVLAWSLNPDGSLAGRPQVVQQLGITDTNRTQAQRHAEQAIRAVQLAAPFNLPAPYYAKWKRVASFRFDRKLSQ